jgi:hypothetical protein
MSGAAPFAERRTSDTYTRFAIAEKFEAMAHPDMQNSRMKDFYGIWILSRTMAFSAPH